MNWKRVLFPVAVAWTVVNVGAVGFAAMGAEAMHASVHGALAVAFGLWAYRLRQAPSRKVRDPQIDVLEDQISDLQRELNETQEGLDFAERLLSQRPEKQPVDAQRYAPKQPDHGTTRRHLEDDSHSQ